MKPSEKILVAGSSVVDLIFQGRIFSTRKKDNRLSLAFGGKYLAENFYQCFGGGGANCAVSLARLGYDVCLWSQIGNDAFGKQIFYNLKVNNVSTKLVKFKADKTPISCILLTYQGERTIITYRSNADILSLNNAVRKEMDYRDWFLLFSLAQLPQKEKLYILGEAKKRKMKIFLSLHGSEYAKGYDYLQPYLKIVDILHLNAHELADIFGAEASDLDFKKTNFCPKLGVPLLLITHDVNGSYCQTKEQIFYHPALKIKEIKDTTGAGDAFASGFLASYLKNNNIDLALAFATKNSASVISQLGAQNGLIKI